MSPDSLNPAQLRALARMARGGVYLDNHGRILRGGRQVVDRGTVTALAEARLIDVGAAGMPRLTGAGRAILASRRR